MKMILNPVEVVPGGFDTYSMFLVASKEWSPVDSQDLASDVPNQQKALDALFYAFRGFGEAIGEFKAAVWLAPASRQGPTPPYPDILRGKSYADRFGLDYNDGPFVVTTRQRPDLVGSGDELVVVKLRGLGHQGIIRVLNILEQDLRNNREIRKRTLIFQEVKERMLQIAKDNVDLLEAIFLKIAD